MTPYGSDTAAEPLQASAPWLERLLSADARLAAAPGECRVAVELASVVPTIISLLDAGARWSTLVATDDRARTGSFGLTYVLSAAADGLYLLLETSVPADAPSFPSLAGVVPAADWAEREIQDLFGLRAEGHPDGRRLMLFPEWPDGVHPLRKDFDPADAVPVPDPGTFPYLEVEGDGVHVVPVGPIHAGVIEPGHFRFHCDGEQILAVEAQLFWKHKGVEKRFEGLTPEAGLPLAERICGACSASNAHAYCRAVERLYGIEAPERARWLRLLALEQERLHNHLRDLALVLVGTATYTASTAGYRQVENLMRLNGLLAGNRLLRGVWQVGGVRAIDTREAQRAWSALRDELRRKFEGIERLIETDESIRDRLESAGVFATAKAEALAVVGPAARASGLGRDVRLDHPDGTYGEAVPRLCTSSGNDLLARCRVRVAEWYESFRLVDRAYAALESMPSGPTQTPLPALPRFRQALGWAEGPRGEVLCWLSLDDQNRLSRAKWRSASFQNWPAVGVAVMGNIVPDFPLVNKSFNLCYACSDR